MKLSLAGWSLNRLFRAAESPLKLVDFPRFAQDRFGIDALELNNIYFESTDPKYLDKLVAAAKQAGSKLLNIAVDEQGDLSNTDPLAREIAVLNYSRWIAVARYIGCSAIRANSGGAGAADAEAAVNACIDSFRRLCEVGRKHGIVIMMENHWGISEDADTMVRIIRAVRQTHGEQSMCSLPDFGNWPDSVDRYASLRKIMPLAHAVHAKVNDIDEQLNHPRFDHGRCIAIVREAGYDGYLGIEYEGSDDPVAGVERGAKKLRGMM